MKLCKEIEKELYEQAKKSLTKLDRSLVGSAMKWIEILINLQKKPNPYQEGKKALELANRAALWLSHYCRPMSSNPTELFPIVNFLAEQSEDKPPPDFIHWSHECRKQFFVTLGSVIRNQEHTILKLDILKTLTADGYTLEQIRAASMYMKRFTRANQKHSQQDLLAQAIEVLKTARLASAALQQHSQAKYPFVDILFAANDVKASLDKSFESNPEAFIEAVEGKLIFIPK